MRIKMTMYGQWFRALSAAKRLGNPVDVARAIDLAMEEEAKRVHHAIIRGIRSRAPGGRRFLPLSAKTKKLKGSSTPLIQTGRLLDSIRITKTEKGSYFVGIHPSLPGPTRRSGKRFSLADIAAIHEGTRNPASEAPHEKTTWKHIIRTSRQAGWFRWAVKAGIFSRAPRIGTEIEMVVPSRPFIGPVWDEMKDGAAERVSQDIMKYLRLAPGGARRR